MERICLSFAFPFRVDPFSEETQYAGKQTEQGATKVIILVKMANKVQV